MDAFGFHPPQFSEDLAWLPPWLQNPPTEVSIEHSNDLQPYQGQESSGNLKRGKNDESWLNESGGCYSCHLFFSGEDGASRNTVATSSNNVLHLQLHLSSDGGSHYSQSRLQCTSQALPISDKVMFPQQVCNSAELGNKVYSPNAHHNDDQMKFSNQTCLPMSVENGRPFCPSYKMDGEWRSERLSTLHTEYNDVEHAVELSTAASEALVIYELMRPNSEALPTEAILEAALQVKQARLEALKNFFCCSSPEADETDSLSDLNDSIMEDAWEDVGLRFMCSNDEHDDHMGCSYVKDTPVSKDQFMHGNRSNNLEPVYLQDRVADDSFSLNTLNTETCKVVLHQLDERISQVSAEKNVEVHKNSSLASSLDKAGRYRSRWFGGWTVKEENSCANLNQDHTKNMKGLFVGETSFLSESADAAPDQTSVVRKHENKPKISSQCSVQFDGHLRREEDEGVLLSQDSRSSNPSLVDSLCSVVPCSLSTDNTGSPSSLEHNGGQNNETCFDCKSELHGENRCKISNLNAGAVCVVGQDVPLSKGESCGTVVQRRLMSLKNYSTSPKNGMTESLHNNQHRQPQLILGKLSSCEDVRCEEFSDTSNANNPILFNPLHKCDIDRDAIDIKKRDVISTVVGGKTSQNKSQNESTKDGDDLHACALVKQMSQMAPSREVTNIRSFRVYVNNSTGERNFGQLVTKDCTLRACQIKNIKKLQSELEYAKNTPNLTRKRVSFSGVELELQQNKGVWKLLSLDRTCDLADHIKHEKKLIFHGLKFLLTGFSTQRETETVRLVTDHGGMVLSDVPSAPSSSANRISRRNIWHLPVILCPKKLQTTKFLYGCAVNALILKQNWLMDSIAKGLLAPPEKYLVLPNHMDSKYKRSRKSVYRGENEGIFYKLGIILHGKHKFCSKLEVLIKHGGGVVFKNLQKLIQSLDNNKISRGVIVAENGRTLRHMRLCASESKIPMMPASWITKSLHLGELMPIEKKEDVPLMVEPSKFSISTDWSQEI